MDEMITVTGYMNELAEMWAKYFEDNIQHELGEAFAKQYLEEQGLRLVPNAKYYTPEEIEHIVMPYGRDVDPYEAYRGWD